MVNTESDIQRLNYASHAIEGLRALERRIPMAMPRSAKVIRELVEMLEHCPKFLLPPYAELLDRGHVRQSTLDLVKLPFPIVAMEYACPPRTDDLEGELKPMLGADQLAATKRIALCWENEAYLPEMHVRAGEEDTSSGIFVASIFESDGQWQLSDGYMYFEYGSVANAGEESASSVIANQAFVKGGYTITKNPGQVPVRTGVLLPELFAFRAEERGSTLAMADLQLDVGDEFRAMLDCCAILGCENAATELLPEPRLLNRKRRKKNKVPFFSYHVLSVGQNQGSAKTSSHGGGSHRSPRTHLRRAHIRRLENKTVVVRAAVVNPKSKKGVVEKDYRIDG